jgi:hypothetical protein
LFWNKRFLLVTHTIETVPPRRDFFMTSPGPLVRSRREKACTQRLPFDEALTSRPFLNDGKVFSFEYRIRKNTTKGWYLCGCYPLQLCWRGERGEVLPS